MTFRQVHRWVSLTVAAIWLVQGVTGTLSVFRWEIDDWTVAGAHVPVDLKAVGRKVDALAATPGIVVSSVWTSGTNAGRFDVHYDRDEAYRVMRIDGQGRALRDRSGDQLAAQGAIWDTITTIHTSLMLDETGEWLIGISGLLLLSNILLGLKLAWPKRGTWRKTLFGKPAGKPTAKLYGWHRKVGLWFAFPALFTVAAGISMVFSDALERKLGAELANPVVDTAGRGIGFANAIGIALKTYPAASFSGVSLPDEEEPWYRVRLRNAGEVPRKWGTTVVWVAAGNGRVLGTYDAASPRPGRAVTDTLYAVHTGQIGMIFGRLVVLAIGLCLLSLIALGLPLWWKRRVSARR
ncbi:MAG: PepSY domain-containing protein [Sphingomonas sp.]|nr:PepSY domain-containing protein [Sphingomonas sp.]